MLLQFIMDMVFVALGFGVGGLYFCWAKVEEDKHLTLTLRVFGVLQIICAAIALVSSVLAIL
ncbi:hypothetical protein NNG48_06995 [Enterococcus faecium]|nr:hypothetical protein [Enterococcus faecium]